MTTYTIDAYGSSYLIEAEEGSKVAEAAALNLPYEPGLCEHIYGCAFDGWAIDVGANIGNHTLWFAAICGLPVMAFEPLTFAEFEANVARNGLRNDGTDELVVPAVDARPVALGSRAARAEAVGRMTLRYDEAGAVDVCRLDDVLPEHRAVALMKIDVEGMESEVLRGSEETIRRHRPVLFTEVWGDKEAAEIASVLDPLGYRTTATFKHCVWRWDP